MAISFSFFKVPKHRVFHYEPRYYDERKEHRDAVAREARRQKAVREGKEWKEEGYVPGKNIPGSIQQAVENNRRHPMKPSTMRLVSYITLLIFFIFLFFFGQTFVEFLNLIR